jgi:hypothetical protein
MSSKVKTYTLTIIAGIIAGYLEYQNNKKDTLLLEKVFILKETVKAQETELKYLSQKLDKLYLFLLESK